MAVKPCSVNKYYSASSSNILENSTLISNREEMYMGEQACGNINVGGLTCCVNMVIGANLKERMTN